MRTCIFVAKILMFGSCLPFVSSCSSRDETPPYTPAGSGAAPSKPKHDAGTIGDPDSGLAPDCSVNGTAGCPCSEAGATTSCGRIDYVSGDYVTCIIGTATCDGTQWGACEGNRIVAQNHRGQSLTSSGIQLLSLTTGCDTPCDPACTKVTGQQNDVDAGNVTFTDAGISITGTTGATPGSGPCKGLWCQVQSCQGQPKTSLSGKVYDPAGKNPLYNASVYVPIDPTVALPAFNSGASCDTCSGATVSAIAVAQTGPDGSFTLNNVPAGSGVALVVQMGKWRRMVTLPTVMACTNNTVDPSNSRLPRNHTDGYNNTADIPKMAIATGSADPFECLLLKAGIDPNEIKAPGNNTRVEYYVENGVQMNPNAPLGATLTGNLSTLKTYDVVLLPCEGSENDGHVVDVPNLTSFADVGGRIFTTHYGYSWLATPLNKVAQNDSEFYGTADWSKLDQRDYNDPMTGTVDQSFPKGLAYAQWLQNVGATTTQGALTIKEPRHDARSAINPPSQRWIYGSSRSASGGTSDMLLAMTFNTPTTVTQDKQCGRVVYSDFHVSADALASSTKASCTNDNACGFTATCNGEKLGSCSTKTCETSTDCVTTGFSCSGSVKGNCTTPACYSAADCPSGRTCSGKLGTCNLSCYRTSDCSGISGTGCTGTLGTCSVATCTQDSDCSVGPCVGESQGTCKLTNTTKSCSRNSDCNSLNTNATCVRVNGTKVCTYPTTYCWDDADCGSSAVCNGEATGKCSCSANADCGSSGGTCQNAKVGTCTGTKGCKATSDCSGGGSSATCLGATQGTCNAQTCYQASECGTGGTCVNGQTGTCQDTCSADTDCATGLTCVAGQCTGCYQGSACPSSTCTGGAVGLCSAASTYFPLTCLNGNLSAQEKALEFMLFDLSACVSPDSYTPPVPGIQFAPVTFNLDFMASCPSDKRPIWREFDWQAQIPSTSNITFAVQTADTSSGLTAAKSAPLAIATSSTDLPNWDVAIIDTTTTGAFHSVDPPLVSKNYLRVATTLNPTTDLKASPTLINWQVNYDCVYSQ